MPVLLACPSLVPSLGLTFMGFKYSDWLAHQLRHLARRGFPHLTTQADRQPPSGSSLDLTGLPPSPDVSHPTPAHSPLARTGHMATTPEVLAFWV